MKSQPKSVAAFLANSPIAVVGYSREESSPGNIVLAKLRRTGYTVFAVSPHATEINGETCYPDVGSIPGGAKAAFIATPPDVSADIVRQCAAAGIRHVWLHRSFGQGSVSEEAVRECEQSGIHCIAGGCPMMYCGPVDIGHRCMRWILGLGGRLPVE